MLLLGAALAHIPHDIVVAGVVPWDLDPAESWLLAQDIDDANDLYGSADGGQTWRAFAADALADDLRDGAHVDGGYCVLLGPDRYWYTTDLVTWVDVDLAIDADHAAGGDALYLAGDDGLYRLTPGSTALRLSRLDMDGLHETLDGVVAVGTNGTLYRYRDSALEDLDSAVPDEAATAATAAGDTVWAGYPDGTLWRWDGSTWTACGADPLDGLDAAHNEVLALATDGTTLALARASYGVAWSTDGCETWTWSEPPIVIDWEDDDGGSSASQDNAWTVLRVSGSTTYLAGYDGAAWFDGSTWTKPALKGGDYTRGIAFSGDFLSDGNVLLGGYGSGVVQGFGFGSSWAAPGDGVTSPNVENVAVPPGQPGLTPAFALFNRVPYGSTDEGASWSELTGPFAQARRMAVGPGERFWALGTDVADTYPGGAVLTQDGGTTWEAVTNWPVGDVGTILGVYDRSPRIIAWTSEDLFRSIDGGATWWHVWTTDESIVDVVGWPPDRPTRVVAATRAGIYVQAGRNMAQTFTDDGAEITRLAVADDATLFATDQALRVWRSDDRGQSWDDTGARLTSQAYSLAVPPGFTTHQQVLAAGGDGSWLVNADGTTARWPAWQRVDDGTDFWDCGACVRYMDPSAAMQRETQLTVGDTLMGFMRGSAVTFLGGVNVRAQVSLQVDGAPAALVEARALPDGSELITYDGMTDDWHFLELTVLAGGPVSLDGAIAEGESGTLNLGETLRKAEPEEHPHWGDGPPDAPWLEGEGCATAPRAPRAPRAPGGLVLGLVAILGLRRRAPRA